MDVVDNPIADQLYRDIFFHSPLGIYTLDAEGIITSFNPKMAELSGDKPENAIGLNALDLESYQKVGLDELFRRGIAGEAFETEVEYSSHLANKKTIRHYRGVPISDKGIIGQSRLLLIVEDITDQKNIEEELRAAAQFTAENVNPLMRIGQDGVVLLKNNVAGEMITEDISMVLTLLRGVVKKALQASAHQSVDVEFEDKIFMFEVIPDLKHQYANLYGREVTEERKNQEIRDHFISVTSHELRTPMTVIRGYIEILLQGNFGELNDTQSDFLHKMLRSVKDLISFVNDTLDLSKIQSGTLQLHIESQSVDAILSNVTDNLQELFDEAKVRLVFSSAGYNVLADQSQFNRVLTNLLSNALKFTPPGGLVSVESRLEGDTVVIEVKDDGIGMNIDDKTVLFQKYAQIENRWVSKMRGTGLGLVISKDLVERMGGKIWVESELDKGSTFFVALPLATSSESTIK